MLLGLQIAPLDTQWVQREAFLMGTSLDVSVAAPSRREAVEAIEDAFTAVRRLDGMLSTWRRDSEISRLNAAPPGQPISLSMELFRLLQEAARWTRATEGAFDPAIGALVDAYDLRGAGRIPPPSALARARAAVGFGHFTFDSSAYTVSRSDAASWIDTGGFGKGAALREARRALVRRGIRSAVLNFGGQVLVIGPDRTGGDWVVPVAHPSHRGRPVVWLHCRNRSASTSSQSERHVTVDGRRIGHVLDPRTGEPVPAWGSVTVVAEDPTIADAVSTALLVLGPDKGLRWARSRDDMGVLFLIDRGGRVERRWNAALRQFLAIESAVSHGS